MRTVITLARRLVIAAGFFGALSAASIASAQCYGDIVVIGDSVSAAYIPRQDKQVLELRQDRSYTRDILGIGGTYSGSRKIFNSSVAGAGTTHAKANQLTWTLPADPSHVIIMLSINDAIGEPNQRVPAATAAQNALDIATAFYNQSNDGHHACFTKVLFVLPPNYNAATESYIKDYRDALMSKLALVNYRWGSFHLLTTIFTASLSTSTSTYSVYHCVSWDNHPCEGGQRDMGTKIYNALTYWDAQAYVN